MVAEKMKLKVLAAIASDLAAHIDSIFETLSEQGKQVYSAKQVIDNYKTITGREVPTEKCESNSRTSRVTVDIHRDVIYIFYVLNCPFYAAYGIHEHLQKDKLTEISKALNINKRYISYYIISGRHHFRFYKEFKDLILENLEYNRKA